MSTSLFPAAMSTPLSLYVSPLWDGDRKSVLPLGFYEDDLYQIELFYKFDKFNSFY